jgi:hypothetical protein
LKVSQNTAPRKYNCVFVIGAGASVPFNFPTGAGLKEVLRNAFSPLDEERNVYAFQQLLRRGPLSVDEASQYPHFDIQLRNGFASDNELRGFVEDILGKLRGLRDVFVASGASSIDSFIAGTGSELNESLGKLLIAGGLAVSQRNYQATAIGGAFDSNRSQSGRGWIDWIHEKVCDVRARKVRDSTVGFITFNYDTVLEKEWHRLTKRRFLHGDAETSKLLDGFECIHIYGKLGEAVVHVSDLPFSNLLLLSDASRQLALMRYSKGYWPDANVQRARTMIEQAGHVVFLGFGFDQANCDLLELTRVLSSKHGAFVDNICASTMHLEGEERKTVLRYCHNRDWRDPNPIGGISDDCLATLRKYVGNHYFT